MTVLTRRFTDALDHARVAHASQRRKATSIPYLSHLMAVGSLVLEHGGSEDQAIAALLHDTVEDQGEHHQQLIREQFGPEVARIVMECTDGTAEGKAEHTDAEAKRRDWIRRKSEYMQKLSAKPEDDASLLVSACDKLHNSLAIVRDLMLEHPPQRAEVFERFTGGRDGTLAYYESLCRVYEARVPEVGKLLRAVVDRMHELAGAASRMPLESLAAPH